MDYLHVVNIVLLCVGILLVIAVLSKQKHDPFTLRAVLLIYFLVVLQYNFEKFSGEKLLLGSAAFAFLAWIRQPIRSIE